VRTLALGDIHGCYRSLVTLEAFAKFTPEDRIITLGDYVDRGPASKDVLEWLIDHDANGKLIALRGNHELMMLAARKSSRHREEWLASGGEAVFSSYATDRLEDIPQPHWDFLATKLRSHYQTKTHFFVHANVVPDMPLADQPAYMLYWESFGNPPPHESGLTMVCGHTPQHSGRPRDIGHAICIDTWVCNGGWLTCLDVENRYCWQASERGATRSFRLDELQH
jgi:serine/threonine protein phosphatase 1